MIIALALPSPVVVRTVSKPTVKSHVTGAPAGRMALVDISEYPKLDYVVRGGDRDIRIWPFRRETRAIKGRIDRRACLNLPL